MLLKFLTTIFMFFLFIFFSCSTPTETPPVKDTGDLYVLEKDHLFGGFFDVDNYHHTLIINTSQDSIVFNVESPTPLGLKRESIRSPAFGDYIQTAYADYFNVPNISKSYLANEPDTSTSESHFWNNLRLAPSEGFMVPYSNYYGEGEELFIKSLGVNNFLGLEVISDYKIERDGTNSSYLNLEIKQTMVNTTKENMYVVGISIHVPKELRTRTIDTTYYNIISDTMLTNVEKAAYYRDWSTGDGFGLWTNGQDVDIQADVLPPDGSFDFTIKMTIEPLLDKFEIYPSSIVSFYTKGERIWPKSIITYNGEEYNGHIDYLKAVGLGIPTYILFSINNGELKVVSPDMIEPTFSPIN